MRYKSRPVEVLCSGHRTWKKVCNDMCMEPFVTFTSEGYIRTYYDSVKSVVRKFIYLWTDNFPIHMVVS